MRLEQHIYTSGKTEFTTVAATDGLSREDRIHLENHSLYILPTALLYQEDCQTPVKYAFYPLGEDRFVVGKAVYAGKDSLGRPGNYLFHNLIITKEDLLACSRFNPVNVIRYMEKKGLLRETVPEEPLTVIELSPDEIESPTHALPHIRDDLLSRLLYACLNHKSLQHPVLLHGTDQECLDFLAWLYPLLPYQLRMELSFDTYTYGVSLGFRILGLPEDSEYRQSLTPSFTLFPASGQYTSSLDIREPSKRLALMKTMITAGKVSELNIIYSMEYCLQIEDYARFNKKYREVSQEIKDVILDFHKETLLRHIANQKDAELLQLIQGQIMVEDLEILSASPEMIHRFVETEDLRSARVFADWFCAGKGDMAACYPFLFEFTSLWQVFLERITAKPQDIGALLEPLKMFAAHYTSRYEGTLLEAMFMVLPVLLEERKLAKKFLKVFETLPKPDSKEITLLRTAVKYDLSEEADLLENLLDSDLAILSETQQKKVLNVILRGVFEQKPEDMEKHLNRLFGKALKNRKSLLMLLHSIDEVECSKKVRKVLKKILEGLSAENKSGEVVTCIQRILEPPSSIFKRVVNKILEEIM